MKLYAEKARGLIGKKIDLRRRMFGYYPMEVKQRQDGNLYLKDAVGVCMLIPEREDDFNCQEYDFVIEDKMEIDYELLLTGQSLQYKTCPQSWRR